MDLINYFENIPAVHRSIIIICGLSFFFLIEVIAPLFRVKYKYWKHAFVNLFFTITTVLVNVLFASIILFASQFTNRMNFGLLHLIKLPLWLFIILGFLVLDLVGAYLIHYIQHKIKWMWKLHLVHHSDMHIDTTSANRHHPFESFFRACFTLIAVVMLGAPIWLVMLYQSSSVLFSQFNHANIALPKQIDKIISYVFVSPNMHKVHHHYLQPLTDTNYGNIFSIWDRLFKTFATVKDCKKEIIYGIDFMRVEQESQSINRLLNLPFDPYTQLPSSKFNDVIDGDNNY